MFEIVLYKDKSGKSEIHDYLLKLKQKNDKNSRIKLNKITAYLDLLSKYGKNIGEPYIKHIENEIWELRPLRDRVLFAYINNNRIILLNIFMKKTVKTPRKEIEKAIKNLNNFKNRSDNNG